MSIFKRNNIDIYIKVVGAIGKGSKFIIYKIKKGNEINQQITDFYVDKTRNWCILNATTQALYSINELYTDCNITIYSNNLYLINAFNHKWINKWKTNGWLTTKNTAVKNRELWQEILNLLNGHKNQFKYQKEIEI